MLGAWRRRWFWLLRARSHRGVWMIGWEGGRHFWGLSNDGGVLRDPGPESGIFVHVMRDGDAVCGERGSVWTASKELFLTQPRISLSAAFSALRVGSLHGACRLVPRIKPQDVFMSTRVGSDPP